MRISRPVVDRREAAVVAAVCGGVFIALGYATGLGIHLDSTPTARVAPPIQAKPKPAPTTQWLTGQMAGTYATAMAPAAEMSMEPMPASMPMEMPSMAPSYSPKPHPTSKPVAQPALLAPVTSVLSCVTSGGLPVVGGLLNGGLLPGVSPLLAGVPLVGGLLGTPPAPASPSPSATPCAPTSSAGGLL